MSAEISGLTCTKQRGSTNATSTFVTNGDEFLNTFNKTYKRYPKFQGSFLFALMNVVMSKIIGEINLAFPVKTMNYFIASESMCRRTFDLDLANLLVPSLCTVQRINANSCGTSAIHCDMNSIKELEENIITMTKEDLTKANGKEDLVVKFSIGFDGTKVPQ